MTANPDLADLLQSVIAAVEDAGRLLSEESVRPGGPRGTGSHADVDHEIEEKLREQLLRLFPARWLGEETGALVGQGGIWCWLVDPHDGTKLSMPRSGKGGGRNRSAKKSLRFSVPITPALAVKLREAATGRAPDQPLLMRADGRPWRADPSVNYREIVREIVEGLGENPDRVTMYALRHSSIVRQLLKNVPIRLVASLHDTSVSQIERNYSRYITEHSDEHARAALLEDSAPKPPAGKVVPIGVR